MSDGHNERELVNALEDGGMRAMRAPSSGSATARELPDVIAGRPFDQMEIPGDQIFGIYDENSYVPPLAEVWLSELKATSKNRAYYSNEEVRSLVRYSSDFGGVPVLGAKFKGRGSRTKFYLVRPEKCGRTDNNYVVPQKAAPEMAFATVLGQTSNQDGEIILYTDD